MGLSGQRSIGYTCILINQIKQDQNGGSDWDRWTKDSYTYENLRGFKFPFGGWLCSQQWLTSSNLEQPIW